MSNHPYSPSPGQGEQPPRRRRSQRYQEDDARQLQQPGYPTDEDRAPLPLGSTPEQPQRARPSSYDYDSYAPADPQGAYADEDYDPPRLWPKLLGILLLMLLLIATALYFLVPKDSSGPLGKVRGVVAAVVDGAKGLVGIKESKEPQLIKFETPQDQVSIGTKAVFTFTADAAIDGVRILDEQGTELKGQLSAVDQSREVWTLSVVFDQLMQGELRPEMLLKQRWYASDKRLSISVVEPTPTPALATDVPEAAISQAPVNLANAGTPVTDQPALDLSVEPQPEPATDAPGSADPFVVPIVTQPTDAPAETPAPEQAAVTIITIPPQPQQTEAPAPAPDADSDEDIADLMVGDDDWADDGGFALPMDDDSAEDADADPQAAPEEPVVVSGDPAAEPVVAPVVEPVVDEPAEQPQEQPATPEPAPATPAPTPMPIWEAQADDSTEPKKLRIADTVYSKAKKVKELSRPVALNMPAPHEYATYEGGVFTFRGNSFRGNAAAGTPEMPLQQLSVLWQAPLGSLRTKAGTLYGLGWTGQPAIIRWSKELREWMNLVPAKKDVTALKEVIVAAQDGKIYFFDLNDGVPTRGPIELGYPMKGSVSIDPRGQPLMGVGQGISQMPNKTGPIGYYMYELLNQKELFFLNGRKTKNQQQFSTNGAFDGTALFERNSDHLVLSGENGLLYTIKLNTNFDYLSENRSLKIEPEISYQRTKGNQADMSVTSEASVAMYGKYIYTVDRHGFLRCVDSDSLQTVWAFDTGDNTDATPALGFDEDGSLGLYTGTTVFSRSGRAGNAVIRRLDAISGKEQWAVKVQAKQDKTERGGVKASPVVGEGAVKDLVFFTVNLTGDGKTATLVALNKQTGEEAWRYELAAPSISSPVAVYNKAGQAFIIQADEKGLLSLLDARTGELKHSLDLQGKIEASPAVYNDVLVIGTCSKDNSYLYGIRLE